MAKSEGHDAVAPTRQGFRHPEGSWPARPAVAKVAGRPPRVTFDGPLGALVRFIADGIMVVNRAGRTLFANQRAADCLGLPSVEAVKQGSVADLLGQFVVEEVDGKAGAGKPSDSENGDVGFGADTWFSRSSQLVRFRDPVAGWDRWVEVRSRPFVEQAGSHTAFLIVMRDVTNDRRRESSARFLDEATRRLTQSLVHLRILEHAAVVAVPRLADECVIIDRAEAGWSPLAWYIPGGGAAERAAQLVRNLGPLLVQIDTGEHPLLVAPTRQGRGLPLSGSMILVPIKQGQIVVGAMLLAMAHDTARCHHPSDLALAEQFAERVAAGLANATLFESEQRRRLASDDRVGNARRAAERRDSLVVTVAYALSNQLSPLLSIADLIEDGNHDPQRLAEVLRRQTRRLRSVIDNMLKSTRIAPGDPALDDQMRKIRETLATDR
jgi:hypothetical protein